MVVHHINDQAGERARQVGLFRYVLIRDAADPTLTTKQRGPLIRAIADTEHVGPFGNPVRVSRATVDRWIRAWRRGGFDALVPSLSSLLCKKSSRSSFDVLGEPVRIGQRECVEGVFPALGGCPSMSRPAATRWAAGLPRSLARSRARLSSISRMASHSSLTTASSFGKCPLFLMIFRSW